MNRQNSESWALITPADLLRSLVYRLPSIVFVTLVITAVIVGLLIVWPNSYRSDGLMYVRLGRGALGIDPTANPTNAVSLQESRTTEVLSIGKMIGSREIAARTVDRLGAEELLKPLTWIDRTIEQVVSAVQRPAKGWGKLSAEEVEAQMLRENAIQKVQSSLNIDVPRNGYTIGISAKSADPLLAQAIAQSVMDEYGRYHVEAHRADGSMSFFENQNATSRQKASEAQVALQNAKNELGWMSPEYAEQALRDRVISLSASLDDTIGRLAEAESRSRELSSRLDSTKEWLPVEITSGVANEAHDEMRGQLYEIEVEESESMAKIGPKHPRYRMLQEKMNASKAIIEQQNDERELRREAVNPVYQDLETAYTTALADLAGLKSQKEALETNLVAANADIKRLNNDSAKLAELSWAAKIAERDYLEHSRRFDEARTTDQLDTENFSDVTVIQDASLNLKKASPSRALLSIIGAFLGLSLGMLQAVLRPTPQSKRTSERSRQSDIQDEDLLSGRPQSDSFGRDGLEETTRELVAAGVGANDDEAVSAVRPR